MLTLTLLRHAKSSWDFPGLDDFLRPLNRRGYRQGTTLGDRFPHDVDLISSSPAVRAYSTAQCLLQSRPELAEKLRLTPELYAADSDTLLNLLRSYRDLPHIALIGHNPGFDLLASLLTDSSVTLKTAHIARLQLNGNRWSEITPGCAQLLELWRPE